MQTHTSILWLLILQPCCHAGKVLPDAGQPANGQLITTAAGQQCLPLNMIRKPDGKLEFLGLTLGQVGKMQPVFAYAWSRVDWGNV